MITSISTLIPPAGQNLISLSQVKLYLSSIDNDPDLPSDTLLNKLTGDASSGMIQFLGVHPGRQQYRELSRGEGGYRRFLSRLPVERGTLAVTFNGEALTEDQPTDEFPTTTDGLSFVLEDSELGQVYRQIGWYGWWGNQGWGGSHAYNIIDTYYAGYLLPDQVSDWKATTAISLGAFARPSRPNLLRFECTTAGTSAASEPTWPAVIGAAIADGSITWTARAAIELPAIVSQWCWVEVFRLLADLDWGPNLVSRDVQGVSEARFSRKVDDGTLAPATISGLQGWRKELGLVGVA
jgi:hypothetical protein